MKSLSVRLRDKFLPEGGKLRQFFRKTNRIIHGIKFKNFIKIIKLLKTKKLKKTMEIINKKIQNGIVITPYEIWMSKNDPTKEELEKQRKHKFKNNPKISVLVPMYNTPINFFEELVDSLINQTYFNWELCLIDGSPNKNKEIDNISKKDERIKYKYTGKNLGISDNTNEALKISKGDYIALLDHDDLLPPNSLFEIVKTINKNPEVEFIYTDEDKITTIDKPRFNPYFKPDFAIDTLRANNYICHFSVFKKDLMTKLKGERSKYDGSQDHDLVLRMSEKTNKIIHIPKVLYHWRVHEDSTAKSGGKAKPYAFEVGIKVIEDHLKRVGLEGKVSHGVTRGTYKIDYKVIGNPKVTILIPNKDETKTLKKCINSILKLTTYKNYEIVIIENNSKEEKTFDYYKEIEKNKKIKIIYFPEKEFNYSKIINYGVKNTDGEYIVQLNNNMQLLTPDWIEKMLGMTQREDVGAVGVKTYYPDGTIQHAGIIIGLQNSVGYIFKGLHKNAHGYFAKESEIQNLSAVAKYCMMAKRKTYEEVGYMNPDFAIDFNDVDFSLNIIKSGKLIIYNPFVEFINYATKELKDSKEKQNRYNIERELFNEKWGEYIKKGDPYFNPNFDNKSDQYQIKT